LFVFGSMTGSLALQDALGAHDGPKLQVANETLGDDRGFNLSQLRAPAKRIKIDQELTRSCGRRSRPRRDHSRCRPVVRATSR